MRHAAVLVVLVLAVDGRARTQPRRPVIAAACGCRGRDLHARCRADCLHPLRAVPPRRRRRPVSAAVVRGRAASCAADRQGHQGARDAAMAAGRGSRELQGRAPARSGADCDARSMGGTGRPRRRGGGPARGAGLRRRMAARHARSGPDPRPRLDAAGRRRRCVPQLRPARPAHRTAIRARDRDPPRQRAHPPSRQRASGSQRRGPPARRRGSRGRLCRHGPGDRVGPLRAGQPFPFLEARNAGRGDVRSHSVGDRAGRRPDPQPAPADVRQARAGAPVARALLHRPRADQVPDAAATRARRRARHPRRGGRVLP